MKLVIKTKDLELVYEDEYSLLERDVKDRIESLLHTIHTTQAPSVPTGTVEEIFNMKK
jgi:hypothetical protein